jgi:MFS family permease
MPIIIIGRVISGVGAAGCQTMVSLIILGNSLTLYNASTYSELDLFPLREVASLRSYVNIVATTGRSLGGPIGGALSDSIGWRWYVGL